MKNQVEILLEDISFNTKYVFLDTAKDKTELETIAKKCRLKLPCNDLAIFKGTYAYVDRQNKNGCTLIKAEVEKALDTLVGKAVDFDHFRKRVVGHWVDAKLDGDTIIAYGVFFKGNFNDDYSDIKELMEKDKLGISFEAWGTKEMKTANTYNLNEIEFAGGALLMKEEPAFDGAEVLEMAKERVLEFASVMKKPETFIHTEGELKVKETGTIKELEEAKKYICSKCGLKIESKKTSCKGMKCEKCGNDMVEYEEKDNELDDNLTDYQPTERARYYVSDMQSIMSALNQIECPHCKAKGMFNIDSIDFSGNNAKVKCVCDAQLSADLTPNVKMEKPGRKITTVKEIPLAVQSANKEAAIEKNWLEILENSTDVIDVIEEAFMNEVEYEGIVELEDGKKLSYKERQNINDDMFVVVKEVKNKVTGEPRKIRMFPIADPAHVRNALARLGQSKVQETLKSLGVSIDSVKQKILKRAKELNMKDLLQKYEKSTGEEQAKLFKETVEELMKIKTDAEGQTKETATLKETVTTKDAEIANLKIELEKVKKDAETATAEIAKRDKEIKDAEIAKRKTELGDLAKDMTDEDVMNEDKYQIAKLKKENAELKVKAEAAAAKPAEKPAEDPNKGSSEKKPDADLDKGSKDKKKDSGIFDAQKRVNEKAFGKETK